MSKCHAVVRGTMVLARCQVKAGK